MTVSDIITLLEDVAAGQPAIGSIVRADIFRLNAAKATKYAVFGWEQLRHTISADNIATYRLRLYYIDRLQDGSRNVTEVISAGIIILGTIIESLRKRGVAIRDWEAQSFLQRFADQCAGVYAEIDIVTSGTHGCAEEYQI